MPSKILAQAALAAALAVPLAAPALAGATDGSGVIVCNEAQSSFRGVDIVKDQTDPNPPARHKDAAMPVGRPDWRASSMPRRTRRRSQSAVSRQATTAAVVTTAETTATPAATAAAAPEPQPRHWLSVWLSVEDVRPSIERIHGARLHEVDAGHARGSSTPHMSRRSQRVRSLRR